MKRIFEQPKVTVYENVEKLKRLFESYYMSEYDDDFLTQVLSEFDIPKGTKTVVELFDNRMQAVLEDCKITIGPMEMGEEKSKTELEKKIKFHLDLILGVEKDWSKLAEGLAGIAEKENIESVIRKAKIMEGLLEQIDELKKQVEVSK